VSIETPIEFELEQYKELFLILYKDYSKTVSPHKKIKEEADECDFID
jgi:hypothetical protein